MRCWQTTRYVSEPHVVSEPPVNAENGTSSANRTYVNDEHVVTNHTCVKELHFVINPLIKTARMPSAQSQSLHGNYRRFYGKCMLFYETSIH
ncbi:unnamed protein product [Macrosiphum euphorbiae]|nr:unnamed protein product [Macrosiphum euphorbiae]